MNLVNLYDGGDLYQSEQYLSIFGGNMYIFPSSDDEDSECSEDRLHKAAIAGDVQLMETIFKNEPEMLKKINKRLRPLGCTPLRVAAKAGHVEVVQLLLRYGAEVDKPDMKYQTPLFLAIINGNYECAEALLLANANPNGDDTNISSPLYHAALQGLLNEVLLLLRFGADPEPFRKNYYNCTGSSYSLQASVAFGSVVCFKALLAAGAEPDPRKLKIPVPDMVVAQMSLIHSIVRYHPLDVRIYAQLFVLFGGYLWQRNMANQLVTDLNMPIGERMEIHELMGNPLKLGELCRISVRREIGRQRLPSMNELRLPKRIINFLFYKDLIHESLLIYK